MDISIIEQELKTGQVAPERLAQMSDYLAGTSSSLMDEELHIQNTYAEFFKIHRETVKSDKALLMLFRTTGIGKRQMEVETTQKKIKVLSQTIGRHLKVAHDQAYNRY